MPTISNSTFLDLTSYGTTTATTVEAAYSVSGRPASQRHQRRLHPAARQRSLGAALQQLGDQADDAAGAQGQRHPVVDLWRHGQRLQQRPIDPVGPRHDHRQPDRCDRRLRHLAGIAHHLGDADARRIRIAVRHQAPTRPATSTTGTATCRCPMASTSRACGSTPHRGSARRRRPRTSPAAPGPSSMRGRRASATTCRRSPRCRTTSPAPSPGISTTFRWRARTFRPPRSGLIEPGIGDAMPSASPTFQQGLNAYRQAAGVATPGEYYVVGNVAGQSYAIGNNGERSLDVGVVASAAPGSKIGLYSGSGFNVPSHANVFTSYQTAFWDTVNNPTVMSSSFSIFPQTNPSSVFYNAVKELFIDGALRGVTMVQANNDFGSSWSIATGLANQVINSSSPFMLLVGGTSLTTIAAAPFDPTIAGDPSAAASLYGLAMSGDVAALWRLVEGGLTKLPSAATPDGGGQHIPSSKRCGTPAPSATASARRSSAPATAASTPPSRRRGTRRRSASRRPASTPAMPPAAARPTSRPIPAATCSTPRRTATSPGSGEDEGTSAATPLWASLMAQVDTDLRRPGPAASGLRQRSPVHRGRHRAGLVQRHHASATTSRPSSMAARRPVIDADGVPITLTGYGYFAGPGYDLTTGLGSPNGMLLARAHDGDRPFADVVQLEPGHARCRRRAAGRAAPTRA